MSDRALSHVEVLEEVKRSIQQLLGDPFLRDLPPDVTPEEVTSRLAVLDGRALTVQLRTYDQQTIREYMQSIGRCITGSLPCALCSCSGAAGSHCEGSNESRGEGGQPAL